MFKYLLSATFAYLLSLNNFNAQNFSEFGPAVQVNIIGAVMDKMEPHLSPDGNALFFNNINDGIQTKIYYAGRINDTLFQFMGEFPVVNQSVEPHLDAVASIDINSNFYWVSTRNYPTEYDNLHHVTFNATGYENFGRVRGNFNIHAPGWIIMDACISFDGNTLLYCNSHFSSCGALPCFSKIGIAHPLNDSTFEKNPFTDIVLQQINDTLNYIQYAPCLSANGLELFYTRAPINGNSTELMSSTRNSLFEPFGAPSILDNSPYVPEGPSISADGTKLYYHKKVNGQYQIFLKKRINTDIKESISTPLDLLINRNEVTVNLTNLNYLGETLRIYSLDGKLIIQKKVIQEHTTITLPSNNIYLLEFVNSVKKIRITN